MLLSLLQSLPRRAKKLFRLSSPTAVFQNTAGTNDLSADGYTWAQGPDRVVDHFGKVIALFQYHNSGTKRHIFAVSNDNGATWSEPTRTGFYDAAGEGFLIRGAVAWDATHSILHACFTLDQGDGAVVYRQYTVGRDGSNNITSITRTRNLQMEVGVAGMTFDSPVCLYHATSGKVLIGWSAANPSGVSSKAEIRLTARVVDGTANDAVLANWVSPTGANSADSIGSSGLPNYQCLGKSTNATIPFFAVCVKPSTATTGAHRLCWVYNLAKSTYRYNHATYASGSSNWSGGLGAAIANDAGLTTLGSILVAGTDTGYVDKHQLPSKLAYDAQNDKLWFGYAVWLDNTNGDSWIVKGIDAAFAVSDSITVYSAGSANTDAARDIFVTGDLMYDASSRYLVVAYTNLLNHDVLMSTYDNGVAVDAGVSVYTGTPADVPCLLEARVNGNVVILMRDFNTGARANPPTYFWETQTIAISGSPTGGSYTVTYNGNTTGAIAWNATAATVQTALRLLAGLGSVVVTATGSSPNYTHRVDMVGVSTNPPQMTSTSSLTGGTPAITHATPYPWYRYRGIWLAVALG